MLWWEHISVKIRRNIAQEKEGRLGVWEKYLSLWVALCIGAGLGLGKALPQVSDILGGLTVAKVIQGGSVRAGNQVGRIRKDGE